MDDSHLVFNVTDLRPVSDLVCNRLEDIYSLSDACNSVEIDWEQLDCVPSSKWRVAVGVWCIFVLISGIIGNVLTLLAIPHAKKKRRYYLLVSLKLHLISR